MAADQSSLKGMAQARGTTTITVTGDDGNGGMVWDASTITVDTAPVVALADVSGQKAEATQEVSLAGVFSDGDAPTITATAEDPEGNRISDEFKVTVRLASVGAGGSPDRAGSQVTDLFARASGCGRTSDLRTLTVSREAPPGRETPESTLTPMEAGIPACLSAILRAPTTGGETC